MKTTKEDRANLRDSCIGSRWHGARKTLLVLDDLDEQIASAEAWKARAKKLQKQITKICDRFTDPGAEHWGDCECYGQERPKLTECTCPVGALALLAQAARPDEPSKPGGGE